MKWRGLVMNTTDGVNGDTGTPRIVPDVWGTTRQWNGNGGAAAGLQ